MGLALSFPHLGHGRHSDASSGGASSLPSLVVTEALEIGAFELTRKYARPAFGGETPLPGVAKTDVAFDAVAGAVLGLGDGELITGLGVEAQMKLIGREDRRA